jgi:hypothetical protein
MNNTKETETMKIDTGEKIWCVTDPTPVSEITDICFETSVSGLIMQAKGGLDPVEHKPAIFVGPDAKAEALTEASHRFKEMADRLDRKAAEAQS